MIAIILVILIVLKLKNRSGSAYKVEETKSSYGAVCGGTGGGQSAALLNQSPPTPQAGSQLNGQLRNGNNNGCGGTGAASAMGAAAAKTKKRETKDVKEWYV